MGKCVLCNSYCKDYHSYCKECYSNLPFCEICYDVIEPKDKTFKNNEYECLCETCYNEVLNKDYRKNYIAEYRTKDGHYVRSKSELTIDNYLYENYIIHAYEKKVFDKNDPNIEYLSDFYLPKLNLYIEFWGLENDEYYKSKMLDKQKFYEANNLKLLNIYEYNIKNIDDYLEKELLKLRNSN